MCCVLVTRCVTASLMSVVQVAPNASARSHSACCAGGSSRGMIRLNMMTTPRSTCANVASQDVRKAGDEAGSRPKESVKWT